MYEGYILVHRKILNNPLAQRPVWAWFWIILLLLANHEDKKILFNGKEMTVKRGQLLTGRLELSKISRIPSSTIERILQYLENGHMIGQQKTSKFRVITIKKYGDYQKWTAKWTSNGHQMDTNNNYTNSNTYISNRLPKVNTTNVVLTDRRSEKIDFILNTYQEKIGFQPTDRKPRFQARAIQNLVEGFIKRNADIHPEFSFESIVVRLFDWYCQRYLGEMRGETLDIFRRKIKIKLEVSEKEYALERSKHVESI